MGGCKRSQDNFAERIRALYILGGLQSKWENRGKTETSALNSTTRQTFGRVLRFAKVETKINQAGNFAN